MKIKLITANKQKIDLKQPTKMVEQPIAAEQLIGQEQPIAAEQLIEPEQLTEKEQQIEREKRIAQLIDQLIKEQPVEPEHPIEINIETAISAGGKTGSVQVKDAAGALYQYKESIRNNPSMIRQIKADRSEKENFGEALAARIALAFDTDSNNPRVPSVSFVTKEGSPYVGIVSKYLQGGEGATVQSLDAYLEKPATKSHIKLIAGKGISKEGIHYIDNDLNLKKELAKAIALSALVGDHDVNPGNMIVIKETNGTIRLGRIDYGHAFNDLMRFSTFGGARVHKNNTIDLLNRETVDGISSKSKLWRDYPGLVPSREMVEALQQLAGQEGAFAKIKMALSEIREELYVILEDPSIDKEQVLRSFQKISEHVSGERIASNLTQEERINAIFDGLEQFTTNNIEQMGYAAEVMDLQLNIRDAIIQDEPLQLTQLKATYDKLVQQGEQLGPFSWIKEAANSAPFQGNFDEFVDHVEKEKSLNQVATLIEAYLKETLPPYEERQCQRFLAVITNPKRSVEDKFSSLESMIGKIEIDPQPKSSFFRKILDAISRLLPFKSRAQEETTAPVQEGPKDEARHSFKTFKLKLQQTVQPTAAATTEKLTGEQEQSPEEEHGSHP